MGDVPAGPGSGGLKKLLTWRDGFRRRSLLQGEQSLPPIGLTGLLLPLFLGLVPVAYRESIMADANETLWPEDVLAEVLRTGSVHECGSPSHP